MTQNNKVHKILISSDVICYEINNKDTHDPTVKTTIDIIHNLSAETNGHYLIQGNAYPK